MSKIDAVFEGGGVKGSAFVGAIHSTEQHGYEFENVAGTSAGSIVAAFVAVGYSALEMKSIMDDLDYTQFKDGGGLPLIGPAINLFFKKGIYRGDFFESWMRELLAKKGVRTFGDLLMPGWSDTNIEYKYKLQVIASDISRKKLLVLPRDAHDFGIDPDRLDIARAVRMSMSIPYFYRPVVLEGNFIVDGGILSNYPVWIFDDDTEDPSWPTIGYNLVGPADEEPNEIKGPFTLGAALFSTMFAAHDERYIEDSAFVRTIAIPTLGVGTTDFDITRAKKEELFASGHEAANRFFRTWNFDIYKARFRQPEPSGRPTGRRERLWQQ